MNEYQRFIQDELDRRNWRPADIEKHGGPSRQVVSSILNDKRQVLVQRPKQETIEGLATAFRIPIDTVLGHVAKAMGFPVEITAASLDDVADEDLLDQLRKRMKREGKAHDSESKQQQPQARHLHAIDGEDSDAEDAGAKQKTDAMPDPELLAAHHDFKQQSARDDEYFDHLGEENQDGGN